MQRHRRNHGLSSRSEVNKRVRPCGDTARPGLKQHRVARSGACVFFPSPASHLQRIVGRDHRQGMRGVPAREFFTSCGCWLAPLRHAGRFPFRKKARSRGRSWPPLHGRVSADFHPQRQGHGRRLTCSPRRPMQGDPDRGFPTPTHEISLPNGRVIPKSCNHNASSTHAWLRVGGSWRKPWDRNVLGG